MYFPVTPGAVGIAGGMIFDVPIAVETMEQEAERVMLAMTYGIPLDQMPHARRDTTDLEVEWTLTNTSAQDHIVFLDLNGANEYFQFDPQVYVIDPDEDDPPPALITTPPLVVPAMGQLTGVMREDHFREAEQDLDAITRGGYNAFAAMYTRWSVPEVTGGTGGILPAIASGAIPLLLRVEIFVRPANPAIVLEAHLRVRDRSERLFPVPEPGVTLVPPSANIYQPPPPPP